MASYAVSFYGEAACRVIKPTFLGTGICQRVYEA